jgi:peptide methionine sulfoxide reductase MsrA
LAEVKLDSKDATPVYVRGERVVEEFRSGGADVDASEIWPGKAVTEIEPAGPFREGEPEHQNYLERYPMATLATTSGLIGGFPIVRPDCI